MTGKNYKSLVIGDVGSGKTYVALLSALAYIDKSNDSKVVLVAPTEVLAYQHYLSLIRITKQCSINNVELIYLSSKTKMLNEEKISKINFDKLINKNVFVIGTHSVFNTNSFNYDMVLVDEQHRFGVEQRGVFSNYPHHFISFTATPIPRTLALSLFNKLDTQFLERLSGRATIKTSLMSFDRFFDDDFVSKELSKYLENEEKIYIVCPKIEQKETEDKVWSVNELVEHFEKILPNRILSLTGKHKGKKDILQDFKDNKDCSILISTSVIEVGVDISNAKAIFVVNAERFGLAALHQLRGRVGRNDDDNNKCFLVVDKKYLRSNRLSILTQSDDGFQIAESDMKNRGFGDISGSIQSGFSDEIEMLTKPEPNDLAYLTTLTEGLVLSEHPRLEKYISNKLKNYHGE
ncbi:MAG: DEAD/DEAH box helicase [Patescibacteria group bacterium]